MDVGADVGVVVAGMGADAGGADIGGVGVGAPNTM